MSAKLLYAVWGGLFILCAALGFIPEPSGAARGLLTALSVVFFLPPFLLLRKARQEGNRTAAALVRNLSAASLGLTLLVLVVSVLTAAGPELLGNVLHGMLVIISSPMVCSGYWVLSLFLWACVLMVSLGQTRKK